MACELEGVLCQLLVPDNASIKQATEQLKQLYKDPNIVPVLCGVIGTSQNPQVRQYAAVLLRRKISKARQWRTVPENVRQSLRDNLLQVVLQEQEKLVRNSVAQVVAAVAKHDVPSGKWPQLFQFLQQYTKSQNVQEREVGMFVLSTVSSVAHEQLKPHLRSMMLLFSAALEDRESRTVPFFAIQTMTNLAFQVGSDEVHQFQNLIPKVLTVVRQLIQIDEAQACEALELFDELVECEVTVMVPHVKLMVDFCLEVAANEKLGDSIRIKTLSFISWLTRLKKKALLKHKLIQPILNVLFPVMCSPHQEGRGGGEHMEGEEEEEEDEEEDEYGSESSTPNKYAAQVMDMMALHLPPEKFIPNVMRFVEPALHSQNPQERKAAFITVAVITEGCSDHIRNKLMAPLLQSVCKGITDDSQQVANAAMFALGQFCEFLQPDISKYASELLPLLFDYLNKAINSADKNPGGLVKTYFALETFCENLGKDILPYLPVLMERLLSVLSSDASLRMKELAFSAIGAAANAAEEQLLPYFPAIMEQLKLYLAPTVSADQLTVQVQAIDTLGALARTIGKENFQPLAVESIQLGINLLVSTADPDLRRCVYGLFAAIASLGKTDMAPYLQTIVSHMLDSVKSTEGITAHYNDEDSAFHVFEDEEEEEDVEDIVDEEDEDDDIAGFSVENAYLNEKEDACCSLGEIASHTGAAFMPYLQQSFQAVTQLYDHPAPNIRKGSIIAVGHLCCTLGAVAMESGDQQAQQGMIEMLSTTVPKLISVIEKDSDRFVVMAALQTIQSMLEKVKAPILQGQGHLEGIAKCVKDVFQQKTACQDESTEEDTEDDEAEYDLMLIEHAGDVISHLAKAAGGAQFAPYMAGFLPELLKRLKKNSSIAEKSFAIGTLAETTEALGPAIGPFVQHLYPVYMTGIRDEDEEVRGNAAFAIGILVANSGDALLSQYPHILEVLYKTLQKESVPRVMDNTCAAVCRLIFANPEHVPLDQVLPVVLQFLPLKEDFEENVTVFSCIGKLYGAYQDKIVNFLPKLIYISAQVIGTEQINQDIQNLLVQMVVNIQMTRADVFQQALSSMPQELANKLLTCDQAT
ncbi:importin-4-like [Lingula anatina]|uniref:Importin-4-like n=1 Tax=Lingula anatina TaxID=7574 RepID=A0A1S3JKB8_LINAN|nr:importin-4-like [Lingula anatina]|eukprot:XP_013410822.1 importin-4-like [Lingula anatina]